MIDYNAMREIITVGLSEYVGAPVIRGNQTAPVPPFPYMAYNITTLAGANNGTWQQHEDGVDRKMVRSIWSFSSLSDDWDESVQNAIKAREWFDHTGRTMLSEHGIIVQNTTEINNRDNILTVDYERKNGFDVVFYLYDEVENIVSTNGYIVDADIAHERMN